MYIHKNKSPLFVVLAGISLLSSLVLSFPLWAYVPNTEPSPYRSFPSLPLQYKENRYREIQQGFEERANLFLKGKKFHPWTADRPEKEIIEEFEQLKEWRKHTWYSDAKDFLLVSRPDFRIAQDLLEKGYFRKPQHIAFAYNQSDGMYNASTIVLNNHRFLALEAPSQKTLRAFFILLQNHGVRQLVRLTPAKEENRDKSFPYWQNRVKFSKKTQANELLLPPIGLVKSYPLYYIATEEWKDNRGIAPEKLLKLIEEARSHYNAKEDLMACHCSAGVGRTGTFIAGFLLLEEIDQQLKNGIPIDKLELSIEKIVMQLSLQRVNMVAKKSQYLTLYRLVDLYIQKQKNKIHE